MTGGPESNTSDSERGDEHHAPAAPLGAPGTCAECGYDLRAHGDAGQCPECGRLVLSGEVVLEGVELALATGAFGSVALMRMVAVLAAVVWAVALAQFAFTGRFQMPAVVMFLATVALVGTLGILLWRTQRHSLRLSPRGIELTDHRTFIVRQEPWLRGVTLEAEVMGERALAPMHRVGPLAQLQFVQWGDVLLQFSTRLTKSQAEAIGRQVGRWSETAAPSADSLAAYRSCGKCLTPGCGCAKGEQSFLVVPMFDATAGPRWPLLIAPTLGLMLQFVTQELKTPGSHRPLALPAFALLMYVIVGMLRPSRGRPTRQLRLSADGSQAVDVPKPTPLKLKAWKGQNLHLKRYLFQRPYLGFVDTLTGLVPTLYLLDIPNPALDDLRREVHYWSHGTARKSYGFPIETTPDDPSRV